MTACPNGRRIDGTVPILAPFLRLASDGGPKYPAAASTRSIPRAVPRDVRLAGQQFVLVLRAADPGRGGARVPVVGQPPPRIPDRAGRRGGAAGGVVAFVA